MALSAQVGYHWCTFATGKGVEEVMGVLGGGFSKAEARGGFGHPHRTTHESGAVIFHGSRVPGQPLVVDASGTVCEGWAGEVLGWAQGCLGWVTRLDVAADLDPAELARRRLVEMHRAWRMGKVETRMKSDSHHLIKNDAPGEGWTGYWGGKTAALKLRAYDRRGPLRLEWEWRPERDVGQYVPEIAAKRGPSAVWRSLASACVFPMSWYRELLEGEAVEWGQVQRVDVAFRQALEQFKTQWGANMWAFLLLGLKMEDLAKDPGEELRGDVAAKLLRWADEAEKEGYTGGKLRAEVQCRLKSKRG